MNERGASITKALNGFWLKLRAKSLVWDTLTTTFLSTIGKGIGFLIPFFIAFWFGVTSETDAFFFAYGLILFLSGIFAPVVESVIVSYIAEARAKSEDVGRFVGNVLGLSGIGLPALAILFLLVIKPVLLVVTRFDAQALNLVFWLLVETAPLIILLTWTGVLAGTLNAYKKFAFPALSPAFRAVINLAIIFTFKDIWGVHAIAWGYVIGEALRLIILFVAISRFDLFSISFSIKLNARLKEFLKTASYQVLGMVAVGLNPIVDKTMASWLGKGSVSVLYYADILYIIPVTFMTTGLMVTLLSHWSERFYKFGHRRLNEDVKKAVKVVGFITLPMMLLLILFHQPIVKFAFGRGAFAQARLPEVGWVWVCYLCGFVPYIVGRLFVQAHLVLKNTKILLHCALYLNFLNIFLNYILMKFFSVAGIALATSIISVFSLLFLAFAFNRIRGWK
ncbi:MAG: oligosaccharide flippase family protein [Deltaproteobacteria bacterium]|nr:oligosaccharide flippase family protein [Deltaproteobacteria bacterium]